MVFLVSKISKGSRMDQIYIPKERVPGFETGTAVLIEPVLEKVMQKPQPYHYNSRHLEPIKIAVIEKIFEHFEGMAEVDNVLVAGSFLEEGFGFEDVDTIVLTEKRIDDAAVNAHFKATVGIDIHLICLPLKQLLKGIGSDPLFQMLISKFVAKKRLVMPKSRTINYRLLDLQLLESGALIDGFDFLNGREKYKMVRNAVAIACFLENKPLNASSVDNEIELYFGEGSAKKIRENSIEAEFRSKYALFHKKLLKRIFEGVKNESK